MKKFKFKQAVQIGDNVTDIIKLRCISFVDKNPQPPESFGLFYYYHLYPGLMWDYKMDLSHRHVAYKGDWLCEDENNRWHILSDEEYQREYGHGVQKSDIDKQ